MLLVEIPRPRHVPNLLLVAATHHRRSLKADAPIAILSELLDDLETELGEILFTNQTVIEFDLASEGNVSIFTEAGVDMILESASVIDDLWLETGDSMFTELSQQVTSEG